jgi:hypothetical protein
MSTNTEQPTVESPAPVVTETENTLPESTTTTEDNSTAVDQVPVVEEQKPSSSSSSWFTNLGLSPNLTNQLTNLSSSFMQVTSKVSAAANTLVQKTLPQRPSTPEQTEVETKTEEEQPTEQTSEENTGLVGINKDLTSMYLPVNNRNQ